MSHANMLGIDAIFTSYQKSVRTSVLLWWFTSNIPLTLQKLLVPTREPDILTSSQWFSNKLVLFLLHCSFRNWIYQSRSLLSCVFCLPCKFLHLCCCRSEKKSSPGLASLPTLFAVIQLQTPKWHLPSMHIFEGKYQSKALPPVLWCVSKIS